MTQSDSEDHVERSKMPSRGIERRCRKQISPPPYQTREGTVQSDRRSHMDRRSSWIRDFFIEHSDGES